MGKVQLKLFVQSFLCFQMTLSYMTYSEVQEELPNKKKHEPLDINQVNHWGIELTKVAFSPHLN